MRAKLLGLLRFAYDGFAPLVVFLVVKQAFELRAAIAAAVGFGVIDLAARALRKRPVTRLYLFSFLVTIAFGAIDLHAATPFVFAYEASITNLLTAGFFGITLVRGTPLIEEIARKGLSSQQAERADVRAYLRFLTGVWTAYFVVKAGLYGWLGATLSIERAMAVRSLVGTASMVTLLIGETLVRRPLFRFLQRRGILPPAPAEPST
jgi:uncharacterized membrane protein